MFSRRENKSAHNQRLYIGKEKNLYLYKDSETLAGKLCVKNLSLNVFKNR